MLDRVWLRSRSCLSLITSRNQIKVYGSGRNWSLIILLHKWKHLWLEVLLRLKLHRNQPTPFSKNDWRLCPIHPLRCGGKQGKAAGKMPSTGRASVYFSSARSCGQGWYPVHVGLKHHVGQGAEPFKHSIGTFFLKRAWHRPTFHVPCAPWFSGEPSRLVVLWTACWEETTALCQCLAPGSQFVQALMKSL